MVGVTTYLSQSTNQPASSAQATLNHAFEFVSYGNIGVLAAAADFLAITLASLVGGLAYHYFAFGTVPDWSALLGVGANSGLLFVLLTTSRGFYRTRAILSGTGQANGIISAWVSVLLVVTALLFLLKVGSSYSRGSTITFGILGLPVLLALRAVVRKELSKRVLAGAISGPRCILIGDQEELHELSPLDLLQKFGIREVGRFEFPLLAEVNHEIGIIDSAIAAARHANESNQSVARDPARRLRAAYGARICRPSADARRALRALGGAPAARQRRSDRLRGRQWPGPNRAASSGRR